MQPTHIVVLGAGYAGMMAAMRLARTTDTNVAITLINADDTFRERVRHHQLAAGQPLRHHAVASLLRGTRIRLLLGTVTALQPDQREVTVNTSGGVRSVGYDFLVYALGSFVRTDDTPGAHEHAHTLDHASALALAARLPDIAARRGQVLVVGAGNTGVEVATELAETYPGLKIRLVTRGSFARQLSPAARAYIRKVFRRLAIQFVEETAIVGVDERSAHTSHGEAIPFDICVWAGGFGVSDLARATGLRVNEGGQILIDRAMRSLSHPEIYAVGDAAAPAEEPGAPVRMALYTALAMGAHGADSLAARLRGASPTAFGLSYGALGVSLGRRDGVVQFLDGNRDTPLNLIVTGSVAHRAREFFVRLAVWAIKAQRSAPWTFYWPGKNKMRRVAVRAPRSTGAAVVGTEPALRG